MRSATAKSLRRLSYEFAAEWLKTLLSEDLWPRITPEYVREFEKEQEKYVWTGGTRRVSAYSSKHFYKRMKVAYKKGIKPDFMVRSKELG